MPLQAIFGQNRIVRPLLGFSRAALQVYAQDNRLEWIEDPTNRELHQRRNFLRTEILPRLSRHWPLHASMLARTARHAVEAMELLDEVAKADLIACQYAGLQPAQALSVGSLVGLSASRQRNLLRYWLRGQGLLPPAESQMKEVLARIHTTPRSRQARVCWPGVEVWRYRNLLVALTAQPDPDPTLDVDWDLHTPLTLPGIGRLYTVPVAGQGLSLSRLHGHSVHIRLRTGGESLLLEGRKHHHTLKKLLQAEGVPPWLRRRLPLLYLGTDLVAVADRWVCAPYRAGDGEAGLNIVWEPGPGHRQCV